MELTGKDIKRAEELLELAVKTARVNVDDDGKKIIESVCSLLKEMDFDPTDKQVVVELLKKYMKNDKRWNWIVDRMLEANVGKYPLWWNEEIVRLGLFH